MSHSLPPKALIAMSGGVDSSVAAYLMQQQGFDCTGVTMKLYDNAAIGEPAEGSCCTLADIEDARNVCAQLGVPHYVFNFSADFAAQVIDRFIAAYSNGITPNPCIDCNRFLKFERLLTRARQTGFDRIVTGHYARVVYDEKTGRYLLRRGLDAAKDQSYVLYALTQEQLALTSLPLGDLTKEQVRAIAEQQGFGTAHKDESQDICFVPGGDYVAFIRRYSGREPQPGPIIDVDGRRLGTHGGVAGYTIGQRKGLGITGKQPYYVRAIDATTNTLTVGGIDSLCSTTAIISDANLIACERLMEPLRAMAKHRYRQLERPVTVEQLDAITLKVVFDQPQKALTRGQALVIYQGDTVLGGGTITQVGDE